MKGRIVCTNNIRSNDTQYIHTNSPCPQKQRTTQLHCNITCDHNIPDDLWTLWALRTYNNKRYQKQEHIHNRYAKSCTVRQVLESGNEC